MSSRGSSLQQREKGIESDRAMQDHLEIFGNPNLKVRKYRDSYECTCGASMPLPYIITVITGSLKENGPTTPQLQSHATILARKDTSQLEASLARQPVSRFIYSGVVWLT